MMVLQLLFVAFLMPETKGVPLEELQHKLIKSEAPKQEAVTSQTPAL